MSEYFTPLVPCEVETRVKDSRFLAWLAPAQSKAEAETHIAVRSHAFLDATHNCYAFRVGMGAQLLAYANDAHEPAGSAGRPMLQVLEARKLTNIAAVVTRYFGGTKLGIGGLRRAYGGALQAAVAVAQLRPLIQTRTFEVLHQYADSASVDKALRRFDATVLQNEFGEHVQRRVTVRAEDAEEFLMVLRDLSAGRVLMHEIA